MISSSKFYFSIGTKARELQWVYCNVISFISLVGSGVQLGPLGTAGTDWPIVPAPGDYDDGEFGGMKIGRGNPPQRHFVHHKSNLTRPGIEPGPPRWEASD
jgi:hypothetical protein